MKGKESRKKKNFEEYTEERKARGMEKAGMKY